MFKTSVATRVISLVVLISLLLASFPTAVAAAKGNNGGLEAKWAKLMDLYHRQLTVHNSASLWVAHWISDHRNAPERKKAELQKDLAISNAAWAPVPSIVLRHSGFDAHGTVVDKAAARQSVKELSRALQRHSASIRKLRALLRQYKLEG